MCNAVMSFNEDTLRRVWDEISDGTCVASPVEATSSAYKKELKYWATVVERFVLHCMFRIKSYEHFNL
jgi:hypothetical protein